MERKAKLQRDQFRCCYLQHWPLCLQRLHLLFFFHPIFPSVQMTLIYSAKMPCFTCNGSQSITRFSESVGFAWFNTKPDIVETGVTPVRFPSRPKAKLIGSPVSISHTVRRNISLFPGDRAKLTHASSKAFPCWRGSTTRRFQNCRSQLK